jgi:hypothetical protein
MGTSKRLFVLFFSIPILFLGCKATVPTSAHTGPDAIFFAPEYPTLRLESLAYLATATLVADPDAAPTVDRLLRTYLMGGQQKFLVVDEASARARASKEGAVANLDKVIRAWRDQHTTDPFILKDLGQKLGVDGFIFGDLTDWREETVDWTSEGNSFTEIGLSLSIFDARTGVLAWKAEKLEHRESEYYRHGTGVGSGVYNAGGVERTERSDKIVPPPPKPEEVADSVVRQLIEALPDRPAANPARTSP